MPHQRGGGLLARLTGNVVKVSYNMLFSPACMQPMTLCCVNLLPIWTTICLIMFVKPSMFCIIFCQTKPTTSTIFNLVDILTVKTGCRKKLLTDCFPFISLLSNVLYSCVLSTISLKRIIIIITTTTTTFISSFCLKKN